MTSPDNTVLHQITRSRSMTPYESIQTERDYQDRKWGTPAEHPHEVGGWLTLMQVHLTKAMAEWSGANNDHGALIELRKVLAIGVACAEQHGLPHRSLSQPVSEGGHRGIGQL